MVLSRCATVTVVYGTAVLTDSSVSPADLTTQCVTGTDTAADGHRASVVPEVHLLVNKRAKWACPHRYDVWFGFLFHLIYPHIARCFTVVQGERLCYCQRRFCQR
ncbi:hypothetical protein ElyMa_006020500 [Elysia marginata]|uniref:Secreted protein n=1 Tax=Elysia marginata TaxID=1093978 RepID=A0AAV4GL69_9GAST|nr:hypothetical protein ElyMa_006020500 [Elysia marginata]